MLKGGRSWDLTIFLLGLHCCQTKGGLGQNPRADKKWCGVAHMVRRGFMVRRGSTVRRGFMGRRGSWCGVAQLWCGVAQFMVRRGSVHGAAWLSYGAAWLSLWCGVAQLVARRLAGPSSDSRLGTTGMKNKQKGWNPTRCSYLEPDS